MPAQTEKGLAVSSRFILKWASSTGKDLPMYMYLALTETTLCTGTQLGISVSSSQQSTATGENYSALYSSKSLKYMCM